MTKVAHHFDKKGFGFGNDRDLKHNLTHDKQICSLLQNFSIHVHGRMEKLASATEELNQRTDDLAMEVNKTGLAYMQCGDHQALNFGISDGDNGSNSHQMGLTSNAATSMDEEDTLVQNTVEEDNAIKDGIAALELFHDSQRTHQGYESEHFFEIEDHVDASECDEEYASADIFNQRPLPFIVGSKAFMQCCDGGIGTG